MRQLVLVQSVVLCTCAVLGVAAPPLAPGFNSRPHIVVVIGDDFGWNSVGYHGNREIQTPTLDRLATTGLRLQRHYVFKYCSPTRSSFLSGRLPIHVNQNNDINNSSSTSGIDLRMTLLPQLLKRRRYRNHLVGKGHIGARSLANLPVNRGFDSNLGCFKAGDHRREISGQCPGGLPCVDLWKDRAPAFGLNGTLYTAELYTQRAVQIIEEHAAAHAAAAAATTTTTAGNDEGERLFLYLAYQMTHTPLDAPADRLLPSRYPAYNTSNRLQFNAMASLLDEGVANVTAALARTGLWNNTLLLFTADNGAWIAGPKGVKGGANGGGSNYPLRGGKSSDFEGGVRSVAFLSGGFLPPRVRGGAHGGLLHVCDWYATFANLAGVPPAAMRNADAGSPVPPPDAIDAWPSLLTPNVTVNGSIALGGRAEVPLSYCLDDPTQCYPTYPAAAHGYPLAVGDAALIRGEWKVVWGRQAGLGYWQGPVFPNSTAATLPAGDGGDASCLQGCLFRIAGGGGDGDGDGADADEEERLDLREQEPARFAAMVARLRAVGRTTRCTDYTDQPYASCLGDRAVFDRWRGFSGPVCLGQNNTSAGSVQSVAPAPVTWVSSGTRAGQALLLGVPQAARAAPQPLTAWVSMSTSTDGGGDGAPAPQQPQPQHQQLPVLQQGNGTVAVGLPANFTLLPWQLQLCAGGSPGQQQQSQQQQQQRRPQQQQGRRFSACTAPTALYGADLYWASCDGAACAPGGSLRLFGRRLAFDAAAGGGSGFDCRALDSRQPFAGSELRVRLTPLAPASTAAGVSAPAPTVVLKAARQSCFEAGLALPFDLRPGPYSVEISTVVGGVRTPYTIPVQTDQRVLQVVPPLPPPSDSTPTFHPVNYSGAAVRDALAAASAAAAAASGGAGIGTAVVQLDAGTYAVDAGDTLVVGQGVALRGAGTVATTLSFGRQTAATSAARRHLGLIHGDNTSAAGGGWRIEDLTIEAPQADHLSQYTGSPVLADCGADGTYSDGNWHAPVDPTSGLNAASWACSGLVARRVRIVVDKACADPGTAWPMASDWGSSCGGYTAVNKSYAGADMFAGVPPAVTITGANAVLEGCEIVHYGTCGSNVAPAIKVNSAANVVLRGNTLRYGCAAYSFEAVSGLVFEGNTLLPYKNASGGGSNVDTFGRRQEMRRLFFANNTQLLLAGTAGPSHLETMTLDAGAGFYEGSASVLADGVTLVTDAPGVPSSHRASWRFAAVLLLAGPGAGQWRRAELVGATNTTWRLERPFAPGHFPVQGETLVEVTKLEAQLLFVGNRWAGSHFQLYAACYDCVVAENSFGGSFAASWGRNPHALFGGWQPNLQVEWLGNSVRGGAGIVLLTSDQPMSSDGRVNATFAGALNSRIVLRGNVFDGGDAVQLGGVQANGAAQTNGNVLVDGNRFSNNACNLTVTPMPAGADINDYLACGRNCAVTDVVLHGNELESVRSCA